MAKLVVKRLFWDIETSPNVVLAFRAGYGLDIKYESIIAERKVICIGYKWEGDKKPTVVRWDKNQDDKSMLREFVEVANEADEMVHHFGDRFDLPWLRTRCLVHRLPPLPLYKTIDTKMLASKYFLFNANNLDYIAKFLGHGGKEKMEFDDWKKITLNNDKAALDKMCHYCGVDVDKLELVFNDFRQYVKPETHVGVLYGAPRWSCPYCGSLNVKKSKTRTTTTGGLKHQMLCECQAYFQVSDSVFKNYNGDKSGIQKVSCSSKSGCRCAKS